MDTEVPTGPEIGERIVMNGLTVKDAALLAAPFTVTTTVVLPAVRLDGTGAIIFALVHDEGVDATPPKVTVLLP